MYVVLSAQQIRSLVCNQQSGPAMTDRLLLMHLQKQNQQSIAIASGLTFIAPIHMSIKKTVVVHKFLNFENNWGKGLFFRDEQISEEGDWFFQPDVAFI